MLLGLCTSSVAAAQPGMGDTASAPRCEVGEQVEVMALVYNESDPSSSFAMVAAGRGNGRMVGVGSHVAGRPVLAVLPRALWLGPQSAPCWLPLDHEGEQRVSGKSKAPAKATTRKRKPRKKR